MSYSPDPVFIAVGDTVEWTWDGNRGHSATSGTAPLPDGLFDSGVNTAPFTFSYTFMTAGSFPYFCMIHQIMMTSSVEVSAPTPVNISGATTYCSNPVPGPVPDVTLTLTGSASGSTLSDGSGSYTFSSLPAGGSYTVTPSKAARVPGSANINTVDVIGVQKQFLTGTFLSGCKLAAADVNGDSMVTTQDVIAVQRFFNGLTNAIANVGKYKFTPASRTYSGITTNQTDQNYDTLVFGDVAMPFSELVDGPSQTAADDGASAGDVAAAEQR
jgi:hypothetical protein